MNIVIRSSIATLQKSSNLLVSLTNDVLCDVSVPPYFSCIGSHIRHILDFYDCILEGLAIESVDLTKRKRDEKMHSNCQYARANVQRVMENLQKIGEAILKRRYVRIWPNRASKSMVLARDVAKLIASDELEISNFFSFLAAMMLAYQPVRSLATLNIAIQQGLSGFP